MCSKNKVELKNLAVYIVFSCWRKESSVGETTWSGSLVQTGIVQDPPLLFALFCTLFADSYITATHSKGFPANHLANTAGVRYQVMPAVADIPCSTSMYHLHFFSIIRCMWARGGSRICKRRGRRWLGGEFLGIFRPIWGTF